MANKYEVYYPAGTGKLEKEIEEKQSDLLKTQKELQDLMKDTIVLCKNCNTANKISKLEGIAHMYYIDNVYTGYYGCSEYSTVCPSCGDRIREYDQPELKKLRQYYGKTSEMNKD